MKVVTTEGFIWIFGLLYRPRKPTMERGEVMAAWRRAIELSLGDTDTAKLRLIAQSRTEPASRVERARMLLAYREDPSFFAVGRALGLHHDNHSAHISKETKSLARRPTLRTGSNSRSHPKLREPQHGSWLNLVEGF